MIIYCIISFIIGALIMTFVIGVVSNCKEDRPRNKVHFYVIRDRNGSLVLYLGKPYRGGYYWIFTDDTIFIAANDELNLYGLDMKDYDNLKWEDEPVEVFLNMED